MYYPYLRGKQFELILLRDNAELLFKNDIHPIIEPVKQDFKALIRAMKILNKQKVKCTLIINPQAGKKPVKISDILSELIEKEFARFNNISLGYILHASSNENKLAMLLKKYSKCSFSLIHYGYTQGKTLSEKIANIKNIKRHIFIDGYTGKLYQRHFKNSGTERILIRNGFKSQRRNADYPDSEHFSDLHITFEDEGMVGFGDYTIVGDEYSETGGPAYAVAIHLTYLDSEQNMFIHHFKSDQTNSSTDPGGKFLESLTKLISELDKQNSTIFPSKACLEFKELFQKRHFPGLGHVKKLSVQHHIELITHVRNMLNEI